MGGLVDFDLGDIGETLVKAREALTGKRVIDPTELARIDMELQKLNSSIQLGQLKINEAEAQHPSKFIAGARPFIMWGCGFALLYAAIFEPLARFVAVVMFGYSGAFPVLDTSLTGQVLVGLLGLGVMRSYDKQKGTDTRSIK